MLKEIYEQPQAFYNSVRAVTRETIPAQIRNPESVTIVACGSSYHAGLILSISLKIRAGSPYVSILHLNSNISPRQYGDS